MRDASCSLSLDFIMKFLDLDCSTEGLKCLQSCIWFHGPFLPFRAWKTKSHGYWICVLWNTQKVRIQMRFQKEFGPIARSCWATYKNRNWRSLLCNWAIFFFAKKMKRNVFIGSWYLPIFLRIRPNWMCYLVAPLIWNLFYLRRIRWIRSLWIRPVEFKKRPQFFMHTFEGTLV